MGDVLQVRTNSQPVGHVEAVVDLVVVFGFTNGREQRIVVFRNTVGRVGQFSVFLHVIVDMDTGETDAHVILGTRVERALVHEHQRLVVVDEVGVFVVERCVGRDVQTTGSIAIVAGQLLLRDEPVAVLAIVDAIRVAGGRCVLAVVVLENVVGIRGTFVVTDTVFTRQVVDLRRPDQLDRQDGAIGATAAELEAVTVLQLRRVLVVRANLSVELVIDVVLHTDRRLADRPVVPDVGGPVTHLGSAERQVLELAREGVEVFTFTEVTGLDVQLVVEELVLNPQLGQTDHVAATIDFLG
ncbi:hypothetical protein D9M73_153080 [compost metagenome]